MGSIVHFELTVLYSTFTVWLAPFRASKQKGGKLYAASALFVMYVCLRSVFEAHTCCGCRALTATMVQALPTFATVDMTVHL